jgi:flagellar assembly factor FliW
MAPDLAEANDDDGSRHGAEPSVGSLDEQASERGIRFPRGLPGFPDATHFSLRPLGGGQENLLLLRSTEDPDLRFLLLPHHGRQLPLRRVDLESACTALGIPAEHAAVLLVVTRQPDGLAAGGPRQLYVNLRAPVVLNTLRRTAVQHVLASPGYPIRYPLSAAA